MPDVEETLRELDRWYNDLPGGSTRPALLSKLAVLELCGWIEARFDILVYAAADRVGLDRDWVDKNVVARNYGFAYSDHLRRMLSQIVGESAMRWVESTFEADNPGKLEELKGALATLWKSRGVHAHTHLAAPIARQTVINAPSWSLNQHRVIGKMIDQYEVSLQKAFGRSIAAPQPH